MSIQRDRLTGRLVGYQVRAIGGGDVIGTVEGVGERGVRVEDLPGHPGHHGHVPVEAIAWVSDATSTIFLEEGVGLAQVVDAPPPPGSPTAWHKSDDWWADLLGRDRLLEPRGRTREPFLHPDQR